MQVVPRLPTEQSEPPLYHGTRRRKKPEALRFEFKIEIEIWMTKQRAHTACRSLSSQTSSNRNGPTSVPAEPTHASRMASRPDALPAASHSWHRAGARSRISCRAWDRVRVVGSGQGSGSGSGSGQGSNSKAATSVVSWRRRSSTRGAVLSGRERLGLLLRLRPEPPRAAQSREEAHVPNSETAGPGRG